MRDTWKFSVTYGTNESKELTLTVDPFSFILGTIYIVRVSYVLLKFAIRSYYEFNEANLLVDLYETENEQRNRKLLNHCFMFLPGTNAFQSEESLRYLERKVADYRRMEEWGKVDDGDPEEDFIPRALAARRAFETRYCTQNWRYLPAVVLYMIWTALTRDFGYVNDLGPKLSQVEKIIAKAKEDGKLGAEDLEELETGCVKAENV